MRRTAVLIIGILLALPLSLADLCIVRGYVSTSDGAPVPLGTGLSITERAYDVTYPITTGVGWPYPNFYLQAFRCMQGDVVGITIDTPDYSYAGNITLLSNVNDINLSVERNSVGSGSNSDGGGGGGGGSAAPNRVKIPATESSNLWLMESQELEIFTYDRWFDIGRYIGTVYKITDDSVEIRFLEPELTLDLSIGENSSVDLNKDGFDELTLRLDKIEGTRASMSFSRNMQGAIVPKPAEIESPRARANASPESPLSGAVPVEAPVGRGSLYSKQNLLLLIVIMDLVIILMIEVHRRNHA
jgi:hypothetical protein